MFVSGYGTIVVRRILKKFSEQSTESPKKNIFISGYSTSMVHGTLEKTQSVLDTYRKNIYFRLWLQYYYGALNLEKNQAALDLGCK